MFGWFFWNFIEILLSSGALVSVDFYCCIFFSFCFQLILIQHTVFLWFRLFGVQISSMIYVLHLWILCVFFFCGNNFFGCATEKFVLCCTRASHRRTTKYANAFKCSQSRSCSHEYDELVSVASVFNAIKKKISVSTRCWMLLVRQKKCFWHFKHRSHLQQQQQRKNLPENHLNNFRQSGFRCSFCVLFLFKIANLQVVFIEFPCSPLGLQAPLLLYRTFEWGNQALSFIITIKHSLWWFKNAAKSLMDQGNGFSGN